MIKNVRVEHVRAGHLRVTVRRKLLQLARPLNNQLKQIRRRLPREIGKHGEIGDSHLALAGFYAADQIPMHAKGGSDIFLFEVGVITCTGHDSSHSPIPACTSLVRLLSQAVIPCASKCRPRLCGIKIEARSFELNKMRLHEKWCFDKVTLGDEARGAPQHDDGHLLVMDVSGRRG